MWKKSHLSAGVTLLLGVLLLYGVASGEMSRFRPGPLPVEPGPPVAPMEGRVRCTQGGGKPLGLSLTDFYADGRAPNTIIIGEVVPEPSFTDPADE